MEAASCFETVIVVLVSAYLSSCQQITTTEYGTKMDRARRCMNEFTLFFFQLLSYRGRAIAQAVSRRLPTAAVRVQTRVWSCGIL
jgi:hypothetical protein